MTWATLIPLILQYGLPYVEKLYALWTTSAAPTQADFDALRALASQTAADRMKANLIAAGIDPMSPQGVALIAAAS
jgi:hypothetical protein